MTLTWLLDHGYEGPAAVVLVLYLIAACSVTVHVLLTKDDTRAAIGWVGLAWLSPILGALAYLALGINRVQRKASRLRGDEARVAPQADPLDAARVPHPQLAAALDGLTEAPLVAGNRLTPLFDGDEAYGAMLEAITSARTSIAMATFLFDGGVWGNRLVDALIAAHQRGVEVRVQVDGIGYAAFSWPHILHRLDRAGVPFDRFLWGLFETGFSLVNLRNHRKILVVDGRVGFTGGMNPRDSFSESVHGLPHDHDLHARVDGPVVRELTALFAQDWAFGTGERLEGPAWFPQLEPAGTVPVRVIPDGPDDDIDRAMLTFHGAATLAQRRVLIVTPYFLPEAPLQLALAVAARRGVQVDVVIPLPSNHPVVDAAVRADLPHLLPHGVRVWADGDAFDHSKYMVVDDGWVCFGSANWDPRSLRLNFEMLVAAHDLSLGDVLTTRAEARIARSSRVSVEALNDRPTPRRLIDGAARLLKPYL